MSRHHNLWQDGAGWFWTSAIVEWNPMLRSPSERFGIRKWGYV